MCVCACHYNPFLLPSSPATAELRSVVTCSCFRLKFQFSYTQSRKRFHHQTYEILRFFFRITADSSADICLLILIIVVLELKEKTKWWCLHSVGLMGWLSKASLTLWEVLSSFYKYIFCSLLLIISAVAFVVILWHLFFINQSGPPHWWVYKMLPSTLLYQGHFYFKLCLVYTALS